MNYLDFCRYHAEFCPGVLRGGGKKAERWSKKLRGGQNLPVLTSVGRTLIMYPAAYLGALDSVVVSCSITTGELVVASKISFSCTLSVMYVQNVGQ